MNGESIFAAALALTDPAERAAYLARVCVDKPDLRQEIEELLRAHGQGDNPLDRPPLESTGAFEDARVAAGRVFAGKYKLRQKLGAGGMGEVWVADQLEPVQRRVAIKVIKQGLDSNRLLARFEQERQALALMDHPNVAKVLDAGIDDGRPYFVMELIKGLPITKYCDEAKLNPRQRLELFVPVCQAVQHAHQKGIIHRDLKPSNVIVGLYDGRPVPKVIDFGVAKATGPRLSEHSIFTEVGSLIGTLEYMSPEQAELNNLDIDTRSDIYALGILLYELLTGTVPFTRKQLESAAFTEMLRIIKEAEPPKPSTKLSGSATLPAVAAVRQMEPKKLTALMRGELDWIVMKAIEKDRSRRYETANGFAMDVQRYLSGETVQAVPPGSAYRLRKFVQRNRRAVMAGGLVLLTLLAGMIGTTIGIFEARRQARLARNETELKEQARLDEEVHRSKAESARDRVATVLDAMTSDITGDSIATQKEITDEQKKFLGQVLTYYKELADEQGNDETTRARVARAAARVAKIEDRLGRITEAIAANRTAIERFILIDRDFQAVETYRAELGEAHRRQATMLRSIDAEHSESLTHALAAWSIMRQLADDFPAAVRYRAILVHLQITLGDLAKETGKSAAAMEHYEKAIDLAREVVAAYSLESKATVELADEMGQLAWLLLKYRERRSKAEEQLRIALEIYKTVAAGIPATARDRTWFGGHNGQIGSILNKLGRPAEAVEYLRKGLASHTKKVTEFPGEPWYRTSVAWVHLELGNAFEILGQLAESEEHYRNGIAIQERLRADFPTNVEYQHLLGFQYFTFGEFFNDRRKALESLEWYDRAIRCLTSLKSQPDLLKYCYLKRAQALGLLRKQEEAVKECDRAIELATKAEISAFRAYRATFKLQLDQVAEAIAEVAELAKSPNGSAEEWYFFACFYSAASEKIAAKKQEYGNKAMEMLHNAVTAGFIETSTIKKDRDLDPLRDRDDFKKLIAELETKK